MIAKGAIISGANPIPRTATGPQAVRGCRHAAGAARPRVRAKWCAIRKEQRPLFGHKWLPDDDAAKVRGH